MSIYKCKLNKEVLLKLPDDERQLFICVAHLQNEILFSLQTVVWSHDFESNNKMVVCGQLSVHFYHLKTLAAKLHEGFQLLTKHFYSNKSLSVGFNDFADEEARAALKAIKKLFSKNNIISEIRNNLAFHYSPEILSEQLPHLPGDLDIYISKGNNANTLYYFAEELANKAVFTKHAVQAQVNPMDAISNEVIDLANQFKLFNNSLLAFIMQKHSQSIWVGEPEEMGMDDLPKFSNVRLPLFTDTTGVFE